MMQSRFFVHGNRKDELLVRGGDAEPVPGKFPRDRSGAEHAIRLDAPAGPRCRAAPDRLCGRRARQRGIVEHDPPLGNPAQFAERFRPVGRVHQQSQAHGIERASG
jgi:hypothetical protein